MKIVTAPNAFKDSLSAIQTSEIISCKIKELVPGAEVLQLPVADGGDGLTDIVLEKLKGERIACQVHDPLDREIEADFCYIRERKLAIIEMASASGLRLLSTSERNPLNTSTRGTGDLIRSALDLGAGKILIGLGGSATNDGGCGMASMLGVSFLNSAGKQVEPTGGQLINIAKIEVSGLDPRLESTVVEAICDVRNPLLGKEGAAYVYGPQKGASPDEVRILDSGLSNLADRIETDLGKMVRNVVSAGAAGGIGAGLHAFLDAELRSGIDVVLDLIEIDKALEGCDLVITGEGQLDEQTIYGKAPAGVAAKAQQNNIPCIAISGSRGLDLTELHGAGFTSVFSICPGPVPLEKAIENAETYLEAAVDQILRCFLAGKTGENRLNSFAVK